MSKTITKKIGGHDFRIQRIPPFDAIRVAGDLQRVFGPAVASLAAMGTEDSQALSVSQVSIMLMDAAEALGRNLDGATLEALVRALIREDSVFIKVKGSTEFLACDTAMVERYVDSIGDLMELTIVVLQHNFAELFHKAAALIGKNLALRGQSKTTATAPEQTESNDPLDD